MIQNHRSQFSSPLDIPTRIALFLVGLIAIGIQTPSNRIRKGIQILYNRVAAGQM